MPGATTKGLPVAPVLGSPVKEQMLKPVTQLRDRCRGITQPKTLGSPPSLLPSI